MTISHSFRRLMQDWRKMIFYWHVCSQVYRISTEQKMYWWLDQPCQNQGWQVFYQVLSLFVLLPFIEVDISSTDWRGERGMSTWGWTVQFCGQVEEYFVNDEIKNWRQGLGPFRNLFNFTEHRSGTKKVYHTTLSINRPNVDAGADNDYENEKQVHTLMSITATRLGYYRIWQKLILRQWLSRIRKCFICRRPTKHLPQEKYRQ